MSTPTNSRRSGLSWLAVLGGIGFLTAGAAVAGLILDRSGEGSPLAPRAEDTDSRSESTTHAGQQIALDEQIHQACTACHAYPSPRSSPRWAWQAGLEQAYGCIETLD